MRDREPTVRSRHLGLALHRAIVAAGMNGADIAVRLGWSHSKVSRLLSGKRPVGTDDVSALLAVCRVVGSYRDELLELSKNAAERGWWQDHGDRLPVEPRTLGDHERSAITVIGFETTLVPALLRTDAYLRALLVSSPVIPRAEIDNRMLAHRRRQDVLRRRYPPSCRFFLDEHALCRAGPGRELMAAQAEHLLRLSTRPEIELRIVLDEVGFHAGWRSFQLMEFPDLNPVVYVEDLTSVLFLERADTVAAYRRIVDELDKVALDGTRTRAWLAGLVSR